MSSMQSDSDLLELINRTLDSEKVDKVMTVKTEPGDDDTSSAEPSAVYDNKTLGLPSDIQDQPIFAEQEQENKVKHEESQDGITLKNLEYCEGSSVKNINKTDYTSCEAKSLNDMTKNGVVQELLETRKLLEAAKKSLAKAERQLEKSDSYNSSLRNMVEQLSSDLHRYKNPKTQSVSVQVDVDDLLNYTTGDYTMPSWNVEDTVDVADTLEPSVSIDSTDQGAMVEPMSIADSIKATAEAVVHQQTDEALTSNGYVYDQQSGLYYHPESGYYYDTEKSLYYDPNSYTYFYYNYDTGEYQFHSTVDPAQYYDTSTKHLSQNTPNVNEKQKKKKQKETSKMKSKMSESKGMLQDTGRHYTGREMKKKEERIIKQSKKLVGQVYRNRKERRKAQFDIEMKLRKELTKLMKGHLHGKYRKHRNVSSEEESEWDSEIEGIRHRSKRKHKRNRKRRKHSKRSANKELEDCRRNKTAEIDVDNLSEKERRRRKYENESMDVRLGNENSHIKVNKFEEKGKNVDEDGMCIDTNSEINEATKKEVSGIEQLENNDKAEGHDNGINDKENILSTEHGVKLEVQLNTEKQNELIESRLGKKRKANFERNERTRKTNKQDTSNEMIEISSVEEVADCIVVSSGEDVESGELSESTENDTSEDSTDSTSSDSDDSLETDGLQENQELAGNWPPCIRAIVTESDCVDVGMLYLVTCAGATIGRQGEGNHDIPLPDVNISKTHAQVHYNNTLQQYEISDKGSQNGTFINDDRLSQPKVASSSKPLVHGDMVQIGSTKLLCHIHSGTDTCDDCEPGIVMAKHKASLPQQEIKILTAEEKKKLQRQEMNKLKKKYGLKNADYEDNRALFRNPNYSNRAEERRQTVGSDSPGVKQKTAPASVHRPISTENVGHKLLQKMGWKEGESLGKDNTGIQEPISVMLRANQAAGLGSALAGAFSADDANTVDLRKANLRAQAQQRFNKIQDDTTSGNSVVMIEDDSVPHQSSSKVQRVAKRGALKWTKGDTEFT